MPFPRRSDHRVPSLQQLAVAETYIEGLEADRRRLQNLENLVNRQIWEIVTLGSYNKALQRVTGRIMSELSHGRYDPVLYERAEQLLAESKLRYEEVFTCPCGHSKWDHDEDGCLYLACRHICGVTQTKENPHA